MELITSARSSGCSGGGVSFPWIELVRVSPANRNPARAKAAKAITRLKSKPSAVFVAGDEMAIGAMRQLDQMGVRVPQEVSFIGFDDVPEAGSPRVSLTTVKQPLEELGEVGVTQLKRVVTQKPKKPVKILLKNTQLFVRHSAQHI